MAVFDLNTLLGELKSIAALDEVHRPQQISPEEYAWKPGNVPLAITSMDLPVFA